MRFLDKCTCNLQTDGFRKGGEHKIVFAESGNCSIGIISFFVHHNNNYDYKNFLEFMNKERKLHLFRYGWKRKWYVRDYKASRQHRPTYKRDVVFKLLNWQFFILSKKENNKTIAKCLICHVRKEFAINKEKI